MTRRFDEPGDAFAHGGLVVFERGWLSSNGILFPGRDDDHATLIDTGYATHAAMTEALVRRALRGRSLRRILNTHLHSDHCGGNARLQTAFGCEVWVPRGEFDKARHWDLARLTYQATGQQCPRFAVHGSLDAGDCVELGGRPWELLASPGHDPESLVFYQPDLRLLLSADALWENGFGVVFPEIEGLDAFDDLGQTLDRLAALSVDWVVPGHGRPFSDIAQAIDRAQRRLASFRAEPRKHALHAAKVLLKFRLLASRKERHDGLLTWSRSVPYLRLLRDAYFPTASFADWFDMLIGELCRVGAVRRLGEFVCDAQ